MRIYLAGPMQFCTQEEIKGWREKVKATLDSRFEYYDPSEFEEGSDPTKTVELDKEYLSKCDIILVNLFKLGVGSVMEILLGWMLGKKVLIVTKEYKDNCWLKAHSSFIFDDLDSALQLLQKEKL